MGRYVTLKIYILNKKYFPLLKGKYLFVYTYSTYINTLTYRGLQCPVSLIVLEKTYHRVKTFKVKLR